MLTGVTSIQPPRSVRIRSPARKFCASIHAPPELTLIGLVDLGDVRLAILRDAGEAHRPRRTCPRDRRSCPVGRSAPQRLPRIMSEAFSAIMIVGALVFEPTRLGMVELSQIRIPSSPRTRSSGSTTAISSTPILQLQVG